MGNDTLVGGAGADHFVFDQAFGGGNLESIMDFSAGVDTIDLSLSVFSGFASAGLIQTNQFWASSTAIAAHAASDRIIYNTVSGALYYDEDGTGAKDVVQIATLKLSTSVALTYHDFVLIA